MHGTDLASWIRALAAVATMFPNELNKQEFTEREVQAQDSNGGGNVRALRVVHEQSADTDDPVGSRINLDGIGYLW